MGFIILISKKIWMIYKKLCDSYGFGSQLDINEINTETVIRKIDEVVSI